MEDRDTMKFLETSAATVKMTSGVPFTGGKSFDSSESEDEVLRVDNSSNSRSRPNNKTTQLDRKNYFDNNGDLSVGAFANGQTFNGLNSPILIGNDNKMLISSKLNPPGSGQIHSYHQVGPDEAKNMEVNNKIEKENVMRHLKRRGVTDMTQVINNSSAITFEIQKSVNNKKPELADSDINTQTQKENKNVTKLSSKQRFDPKAKTDAGKQKPVFIPQKYYWTTKNQPQPHSYSSSSDNSLEFVADKLSLSPQDRSLSPRLSRSLENRQVRPSKQTFTSPPVRAISQSEVILRERYSQSRINPFNKYSDLHVDEDYFSDSFFRAERHSTNSTKSSSASQAGDWWHEANRSDVSFAELGLSEDHFSHPQGHFGLSGSEELELAIENCKELIKEAQHGSDKQKNLVMKLVQLRIKLHEVKEGPEPVPENVKVILSHKMMVKTSRTSKYYCEKCNGSIWGMVQIWYRCTECGYRCHEKCLQQILRTCAKAKVLEDPTLTMELNPADNHGLMIQNYRCWECRAPISFRVGSPEPRVCDYTGRYYCELCHWNDTYIMPARVLHNWDFTPQKVVCRATKQFLKLMQRKAVIRIQDVNPMLFVYVDQLNEIKVGGDRSHLLYKLREEMMVMKKYIISCGSAMEAKLLLMLEKRQHFVESSDRYSMQDLLDAEDVLLPELVNIHSTWARHIKVDCQLCQGRGFCCELCGDEEVLFPFDNIAVVCPKCCAVSHRHCFARKGSCPRCERREKKHTAMS
ncbi:unnamed protein product [Lymnaea stagnalis]|uniref:Phorbol-ester/DAG-type domain-containing protein n=1 Tax=Lymnaea stagnalis TaxID=6523 RepID=A0AAV2IJH2_LYMST